MSLVCQTATYNRTVSKSVEKRHLRPYTRFVPSNFCLAQFHMETMGPLEWASRRIPPALPARTCFLCGNVEVFPGRKRGSSSPGFGFGLLCVEWPIAGFC